MTDSFSTISNHGVSGRVSTVADNGGGGRTRGQTGGGRRESKDIWHENKNERGLTETQQSEEVYDKGQVGTNVEMVLYAVGQ